MTNKPELYSDNKTESSVLEVELKRMRAREKKLEAALQEVFPLDLYTESRPDIKARCEGRRSDIIEYFVEHGINEIDIKKEGLKRKHNLYKYLKEAASLLATELQDTREREEKLKIALKKVIPTEIIDNFLGGKIKDTDIKKESFKYANGITLKTVRDCLKNINFTKDLSVKTGTEAKRSLSLLNTKGNPSNLKINQEHDFAINHTIIHHKNRTVCTWIPKNGCSNIRYSIAKKNGAIGSVEEIEWIHQNNDSFNASLGEALQAEYTFIILRNPYKRLLSFFLDKLCHTQEEQAEKSYEHAQKVFNFNGNKTYSDFIDYIWENTDSIYNDEHTRPQSDFLLYREYDDYFSLEKIKEASKQIFEKSGIQIDDIRDKNSIYTSKGSEKYQEISHETKANEIKGLLDQNKKPVIENMYSDSMIQKVSTLYLQDILLYCREIDGGASELDYWIRRTIKNE